MVIDFKLQGMVAGCKIVVAFWVFLTACSTETAQVNSAARYYATGNTRTIGWILKVVLPLQFLAGGTTTQKATVHAVAYPSNGPSRSNGIQVQAGRKASKYNPFTKDIDVNYTYRQIDYQIHTCKLKY